MSSDTKFTLMGVGVLLVVGYFIMKKKRDLIEEESNFVDNRYNTKRSGRKRANSSFSNAVGCTSGQLAEAMTHCESMAQAGETTSIKRCKIKNNGVRRVTCQYTDTGGGIRYMDTDVGTRKLRR